MPDLFSIASGSFELYTDEIAKWFVPAVISERSLSRIHEVLNLLPGKSTNALGLEFHNIESYYDCDVSLSIDPYVDINEIAAWRPNEFNNNCKYYELIPDIKLIPEIVKAWDDPQTRLSEVIKEIILEIDTMSPTGGDIPLNIFFTLLQNRDPDKFCEIIAGGLSDILDGAAQVCLEHVAKLPKNLFITHLGFMMGRPSKAVRVLIRCETADLFNVLSTLGLNAGDYLSFNDFFNIVQPMCSHVVIAVNMFSQGLGTDFAVECGYLETARISADEWWPDFIEKLGKLGCSDDQVSILSFVDALKKKRSSLSKPRDYKGNYIEWQLNHIKLSFSRKSGPSMKWYISMHGVKTDPAKSVYIA